ncbi:hypothetical protein [Yoonia sp.]|jgi:hypothetical protein|uniref:hypothetical protein n=1 Tax=Yoonia sp. TaxID=2212373 RepID=UPI0025DE6448|nr:hypothetical protein [Yoonia sp.]
MTQWTLTKTRLFAGLWEGELIGAGADEPQLTVTHLGAVVDGLRLEHDTAHDVWRVTVPVPVDMIRDGVQTFVIADGKGHALASFALLSGEALAEDIRAEVELLRSELDLLKGAFRRHCRDTQG